jgi:hypothetical protein
MARVLMRRQRRDPWYAAFAFLLSDAGWAAGVGWYIAAMNTDSTDSKKLQSGFGVGICGRAECDGRLES